jgi:hypothetical protein
LHQLQEWSQDVSPEFEIIDRSATPFGIRYSSFKLADGDQIVYQAFISADIKASYVNRWQHQPHELNVEWADPTSIDQLRAHFLEAIDLYRQWAASQNP